MSLDIFARPAIDFYELCSVTKKSNIKYKKKPEPKRVTKQLDSASFTKVALDTEKNVLVGGDEYSE